MVFGDRALARVGGGDRRGNKLGKGRQPLAGLGVVNAGAGQDQRILGREQHLRRLLHRVRIGRHALDRDRPVVELALELGLRHLVGNLDQHRPGLARAHGVIGAAHQIGQLLRAVRERRPLGHRAVGVGGAEHRPEILPRQRQAAGDDQQRHVLGVGLGDARIGVLDAGAGLGREHAVLLAALDAAVAVGETDADALLPAQDRPDAERRARLDDLVARIAGQEFRALALEDLGNDCGPVHWHSSVGRPRSLRLRPGRSVVRREGALEALRMQACRGIVATSCCGGGGDDHQDDTDARGRAGRHAGVADGSAGAVRPGRRLAAQDPGRGRLRPATAEGGDRFRDRRRDQEPARSRAQSLPDVRPRAFRLRDRSDQGARRPDRPRRAQGLHRRGMGRARSAST